MAFWPSAGRKGNLLLGGGGARSGRKEPQGRPGGLPPPGVWRVCVAQQARRSEAGSPTPPSPTVPSLLLSNTIMRVSLSPVLIFTEDKWARKKSRVSPEGCYCAAGRVTSALPPPPTPFGSYQIRLGRHQQAKIKAEGSPGWLGAPPAVVTSKENKTQPGPVRDGSAACCY